MVDQRIRVVLIEDHGVVRDGLRLILEQHEDIELVEIAADGRSGVRLVERLGPEGVDVLVTDVGLPGLDGVEVTHRVKLIAPNTRVLALTMYADDEHIRGLMDAGADGYLLKYVASEELADAIRAVARGEMVLSPIVARRLATQVQRERQQRRLSTLLTLREREVLSLLAQGATSKDVARRLSMSAKTVENHRARILTKLGVANTPAAIKLAVEQHLLIEDPLLQDGEFFI
jgi:DNA-binding NarL/FixJ family response regulator